ncbi:MAG: helix-turn-helix domain-containing protein [Longimicrobiaceae bacterium]
MSIDTYSPWTYRPQVACVRVHRSPLAGVANVSRRAKSDVLGTFGATVRTYRLQVGLTQEALAERAGVDRTYVGGVERGERNVGLVNVLRLADALQIAPSCLFEPFDTHSP